MQAFLIRLMAGTLAAVTAWPAIRRRLHGDEPGASRGARRALYKRGLQQLPARRPLVEPVRPCAQKRCCRAYRAARRLLGQPRLEGPLRSARLRAGSSACHAGRARVVYTPEVFVAGREWRNWSDGSSVDDASGR